MNYLKLIDFIGKVYKFIPKDILDISCGTGDLVRELYKRGFNVIGNDISDDMINMARKLSDSNIEFFTKDMATIDINHKFDLIISAFDSINYIIDKDHLQKAFFNINNHLAENGYFMFDITTPLMYEKKFHGVIEQNYNGVNISKTLFYDRLKKISCVVFDFGEYGHEKHIQRSYTKSEIVKVLKKSNFKICKLIQNFDFSNVTNRSEKMIFITKKSK